MFFWTSIVLKLDVASFGSRKLLGFAPFVSCNAGVNEEDEMNDPRSPLVSETADRSSS